MVEKLKKIWMNGRLVDWDDAKVHILSHTLHYGMGVFEGIRCYRCKDGSSAVFRLKEHTNRLFNSAHIAQIPVPFSREEINKAIINTLKANNLKEGYIRPLIFIGEGEMGLFISKYNVQVAVIVWSWGAYLGDEGLKKGIRAKISSYTREPVNVLMTKAKIVGNYVNSIMAKKEVKLAGYDEAILLDPEGFVSEGSGENIFIVRNGYIKTTPLTSILEGITRDSVMRIAKDEGIPLVEERFSRDELYCADEVFLTGTAAEVTPVREVDDRIIGEGLPGPVTKKIQKIFFDAVKGKISKYKGWLTPVK